MARSVISASVRGARVPQRAPTRWRSRRMCRNGGAIAMRRRIIWIMLSVPLALIAVSAGTAIAMPAARHLVSAFWNRPDALPALAENSQVHYERGAEDYAREVAALLSRALAQIE